MSPLINNPDLGLTLKEFLQLVELPDSILAPEIVGVIQLADLSRGGGGRACLGVARTTAVAGQRSACSLSSPVAAGTTRNKIEVTSMIIQSATTQDIQCQITGAAWVPDNILGPASKIFQDLDIAGSPSAQIAGDNRTNASFPASAEFARFGLIADTPIQIPLKLSLGTGVFQNHLFVKTAVDNTELSVSFGWTEF